MPPVADPLSGMLKQPSCLKGDMKNNGDTNCRANMLCRLAILACACVASVSASHAQTVFRCEVNGRVTYSHEPCVGARRVDTTPKQGLDTSNEKSRKGADVRNAEVNKITPAAPAAIRQPVAPRFQCDGRLLCSQMTSCSEAKLFLKNCPGVKMDGDRDGVPCEEQWCTGSFGG